MAMALTVPIKETDRWTAAERTASVGSEDKVRPCYVSIHDPTALSQLDQGWTEEVRSSPAVIST